jgi:hypothetical protein
MYYKLGAGIERLAFLFFQPSIPTLLNNYSKYKDYLRFQDINSFESYSR